MNPVGFLSFRIRSLGAGLLALCAGGASVSAQITYVHYNGDGSQQLRQINGDGSGDTPINLPFNFFAFPTWSRDGGQFTLSAQDLANRPQQRSYNIFSVTPATGGVRQITNFSDLFDPSTGTTNYTYPRYTALSPDNSAVAVSSLQLYGGNTNTGTQVTPVLEVYSATGAFGPIQVHTHIGRNGRHHAGEGVDWSPTQNLIVTPLESSAPMPSTPGGTSEVTCLILVEPVPGAVLQNRFRQLTFPRGDGAVTLNNAFQWGEHDYQPRFSPNGSGVAYVRSFQNSSPLANSGPDPDVQSLRIVNVNTGADNPVLTLPQGMYVTTLDWSPDGTALVFELGPQESGVTGLQQNAANASNEVYVVNVDGSGLRRLLSAGNGNPTWKPLTNNTGGGGGGTGGGGTGGGGGGTGGGGGGTGATTPTIDLGAATGSVSRNAGQAALVTVNRPANSDLSKIIVVNFKTGGSLAGGVDFQPLKGFAKIKAGKTSGKIKIVPLPGGRNGKVSIKLLNGDGYTRGGSSKIKVAITD